MIEETIELINHKNRIYDCSIGMMIVTDIRW